MTVDECCPDCGVQSGVAHQGGCDVARCLHDGGQRLSCGEDHDCGRDVWTGQWPGEAECEEFGWWCYFGPDYGEVGWIRCERSDPRARHDLNRLVREAQWDRRAGRWVFPSEPSSVRIGD